MKKIFTLVTAALASISMMGATPDLETSNWGENDFATVMTDHSGITLFCAATAWKGNFSGSYYIALGGGCDLSAPSNYFGIKSNDIIDSVEVFWVPNGTDASNIAWAGWTESDNALNQNVDVMGTTEEYVGAKKLENATWQKISFAGQNLSAVLITRQLKKAILNGEGQSNLGKNKTINVLGVRVWTSAASTDPVLKVSAAEVNLDVNAANPSASEKVTFTGKNLAAGTYSLVVPNLAGLTVSPSSVTVGEDGKLDATVEIAYTSSVDVAAANAVVSLTIGELTQSVTVNYSAKTAIEYGKSINIEQLVLDNGKGYDIAGALAAANIDFENINELDSLNDEKNNRNEPYLGLKLKAEGATMGCWVKAGSTIRVKFGFVGGDLIVNGGGMEQTIADSVANAAPLELTAPMDVYVKIVTTNSKTVVVKQVMIDEPIKDVVLPSSPTVGFEDINAGAKATKVLRDGQILIIKNGVEYTIQGAELR